MDMSKMNMDNMNKMMADWPQASSRDIA